MVKVTYLKDMILKGYGFWDDFSITETPSGEGFCFDYRCFDDDIDTAGFPSGCGYGLKEMMVSDYFSDSVKDNGFGHCDFYRKTLGKVYLNIWISGEDIEGRGNGYAPEG
jgi:hypothetical protein